MKFKSKVLLLGLIFLIGIIFSYTVSADPQDCDSVDKCRATMELYFNGSLNPDGYAIDNIDGTLFKASGAGASTASSCSFNARTGTGFQFNNNNWFENTTASIFTVNPLENFTICAWANYSVSADDGKLWDAGIGLWNECRLGGVGDGRYQTKIVNQGMNSAAGEFNKLYAWGLYCARVYNNGTMYSHFNYTYEILTANEAKPAASTATMYLGANSGVQAWAGCIDEIIIWNRTLSLAELNFVWNNSDGVDFSVRDTPAPPAPTPDTINITGEYYPLNMTHYNVDLLNFNITVNSTKEFNATLYINGTYNQSKLFDSGKGVFVVFNITIADPNANTTFRYFFALNDTTTYKNSTERTVYIDKVNPVITATDFNLSVSYLNMNNILGQINLSDWDLWGINITVDNDKIIFNKTGLNTSFYVYNLSFNPNDYGLNYGHHTLNVWVADTHTNNAIPDYDYTKDLFSNSLTYRFDDEWIKISPFKDGVFSGLDTWKDNDRYVFEFQRDILSRILHGDTMQFYVTSSSKIDLIGLSKYPGHIVSTSLEKWIDFNTMYPDAVVTAEQINERKVLVRVDGITDDNVVFRSLGGLNVVQQNYSFYFGEFSETYFATALETQETRFSLNFTVNDTYIRSINASLIYNGTTYTTTRTEGINYTQFVTDIDSDLLDNGLNVTNHSFYWDYTVTTYSNSNLTNSTPQHNKSIKRMIISDCKGPTFRQSLNFTTKNATGGLVNSSMEVYFTLWNQSSLTTRNYGYENASSWNHQYCMLDNSLTVNADYEALFTASGYVDRSYIVNNVRILPSITDIPITFDGSGATTAITINLVDENDVELGDYIIEAYLYDLPTNNYTIIDSKVTSNAGTALFNLDVDLGEYLFQVKNSVGDLVYTEPKQTLTETEYTFRVILGTTPQLITLKLQQLDYNLWVDESLDNFTLTWDDSISGLINDINLTVVRTNATDTTIFYSVVSTSDNSILHYNVSRDGTYIAKVYVTATEDGLVYFLSSVSHRIQSSLPDIGADGLVLMFLFVGVLAFMALAVSAELSLIVTIFGMIAFYVLGLYVVALSGLMNLVFAVILIIYRLRNS